MKHQLKNGNELSTISVTPIKAVGVSSLAELENCGLIRPSIVDKAPGKGASDREDEAHKIHAQTQRNFDNPRRDRSVQYAAYIKGVEIDGLSGGTPAITIYSPEKLEETDYGLSIPFGAVLTALDGETQTEARYLLAEAIPASKGSPLAITLYHGISLDHARQIIHDTNHYVTPISETHSASFNSNGSLTKAFADALSSSGINQSLVNIKGAGATKTFKLSRIQIIAFLCGCKLGNEVSRKNVSESKISDLNSPIHESVNPACVDNASKVINMAANFQPIGRYNKAIWQMAGVICSTTGKDPVNLNWAAGQETYLSNIVKGKGGPRPSVAEKLAAIELALNS